MAFCTNCGIQLEAGVRFCPNCGTAVTIVTPVTTTVRSDYQVVLVSRGSCTKRVAADILSDLLGYTDAEAAQILNNLPMATAIDLTAVQAQYIAQAMAEYGMEVAIYNGNGIVDMTASATASVYDTSGSFLAGVAAVLAGLTIGNRVTRYERWVKPAPVVFRPAYRRPAPLTTYRPYRAVPQPRPAVTMRPATAVRPIPATPTRPAPAARPIPATPTRPAPSPRPIPATPVRPAPVQPARPAPVQPARPALTGAGRTQRAVPGTRTPGGKPGPHR